MTDSEYGAMLRSMRSTPLTSGRKPVDVPYKTGTITIGMSMAPGVPVMCMVSEPNKLPIPIWCPRVKIAKRLLDHPEDIVPPY